MTDINDLLNKYAPETSNDNNDVNALLDRYAPLDGQVKAKKNTLTQHLGDLGVAALKGGVSVGQGAVGLANLVTGGLAGEALGKVGYDSTRTNEAINALHSDQYLRGQQAVQQAGEGEGSQLDKGFATLGALYDNPMQAAGAVVESLPLMTPGLAWQSKIAKKALAAGGAKALANASGKMIAVGAGMEGAQQAGSLADRAQNEGKAYSDYALPAIASGVGDAAISTLSGHVLGDAATNLLARTGKGNMATRFLRGAATEGLAEELPQSMQEQYFQNVADGKQDKWEGVGAAGAQGLVAGGLMGGFMNAGALTKAASAGGVDTTTTDTTPPTLTPEQRAEKYAEHQSQWTPPENASVLKSGEGIITPEELKAQITGHNALPENATNQRDFNSELNELHDSISPSHKQANDLYRNLIADEETSGTPQLAPEQAKDVVKTILNEQSKPEAERRKLTTPSKAGVGVVQSGTTGNRIQRISGNIQNDIAKINSLTEKLDSLGEESSINPKEAKDIQSQIKSLTDGLKLREAALKNANNKQLAANQQLQVEGKRVLGVHDSYSQAAQQLPKDAGTATHSIETDGKQFYVVSQKIKDTQTLQQLTLEARRKKAQEIQEQGANRETQRAAQQRNALADSRGLPFDNVIYSGQDNPYDDIRRELESGEQSTPPLTDENGKTSPTLSETTTTLEQNTSETGEVQADTGTVDSVSAQGETDNKAPETPAQNRKNESLINRAKSIVEKIKPWLSQDVEFPADTKELNKVAQELGVWNQEHNRAERVQAIEDRINELPNKQAQEEDNKSVFNTSNRDNEGTQTAKTRSEKATGKAIQKEKTNIDGKGLKTFSQTESIKRLGFNEQKIKDAEQLFNAWSEAAINRKTSEFERDIYLRELERLGNVEGSGVTVSEPDKNGIITYTVGDKTFKRGKPSEVYTAETAAAREAIHQKAAELGLGKWGIGQYTMTVQPLNTKEIAESLSGITESKSPGELLNSARTAQKEYNRFDKIINHLRAIFYKLFRSVNPKNFQNDDRISYQFVNADRSVMFILAKGKGKFNFKPDTELNSGQIAQKTQFTSQLAELDKQARRGLLTVNSGGINKGEDIVSDVSALIKGNSTLERLFDNGNALKDVRDFAGFASAIDDNNTPEGGITSEPANPKPPFTPPPFNAENKSGKTYPKQTEKEGLGFDASALKQTESKPAQSPQATEQAAPTIPQAKYPAGITQELIDDVKKHIAGRLFTDWEVLPDSNLYSGAKRRLALGEIYSVVMDDKKTDQVYEILAEQERSLKQEDSEKSIFNGITPVPRIKIWAQDKPRSERDGTSVFDVAPNQLSNMSERAKNKLSEEILAGKTRSLAKGWAKQVIDAFDNGEFDLKTKGLSPDVRYLIEGVVAEQPAPVAEQAKPKETAPAPYSIDDIDQKLASRAFNWTSFDPEKRGESARQSYVAALDKLWSNLKDRYNNATPELQQEFTSHMEGVVKRFAQLYSSYLSSHSNVASTMIAGPANFNADRNRKKSDAADNRMREAYEYLDKAENQLAKILRGKIDNSLAGELAEQEKKLETLKANHEKMKAANAALRKNDDAKLKELGFTDQQISNIKKPDSFGTVGFPSYTLTNNNANIKRVEGRVSDIKKRIAAAEAQAKSQQEQPEAQADMPFRMEQNAAENRLQLFFDGKPDEETRNLLKKSAFKWSPKNQAWQRQLTGNAIASANAIAEKLKADKPKPQFSKSPTTTNAHTKQSLVAEFKRQLDGKFWSGWTDRLLATNKFKVITRDMIGKFINSDAMKSVAWWVSDAEKKADAAFSYLDNLDVNLLINTYKIESEINYLKKQMPDYEVVLNSIPNISNKEERLAELRKYPNKSNLQVVKEVTSDSVKNIKVISRDVWGSINNPAPFYIELEITFDNGYKNHLDVTRGLSGGVKSTFNDNDVKEIQDAINNASKKEGVIEIKKPMPLTKSTLVKDENISLSDMNAKAIDDLIEKALLDKSLFFYKDGKKFKRIYDDIDNIFIGSDEGNKLIKEINDYNKAKEIKSNVDKLESDLSSVNSKLKNIKSDIENKKFASLKIYLKSVNDSPVFNNSELNKLTSSVNDIVYNEETNKEVENILKAEAETQEKKAQEFLAKKRRDYESSNRTYREYLQDIFNEILAPVQQKEIERENTEQENARKKKVSQRLSKANSIAKFWNAAMQEQGMFMFGNAPEHITNIGEIIDAVNNTAYNVDYNYSGDSIVLTVDGVSGKFYINESNTKEPYIGAINAPNIPGKDLGSLLYQIAFTWANNNNKTIVGDPAGLTAVNHLRRAFQMLSNGMRYGSLRHVYPSDHQLDDGLQWSGKSVDNISNLIDYITNKVMENAPELEGISYNLENGKFYENNNEINNSRISELARQSKAARSHGVGLATAKMAIVTRSLRQEISRNQTENGRGMEDKMAKLYGLGLSQSPSNKAILKSSENGNIQAFYNPADDTTYFVADNINKDKNLVGLALHEIGVHALELGKSTPEFQRITSQLLITTKTNPKVKAALKTALDSFGLEAMPTDKKQREDVLHELAAYLVEQNPELNVVQKIIQFFRDQLRKLGVVKGITDTDIISMATSALRSAPESLLMPNVGRKGEVMKNSSVDKTPDLKQIFTDLDQYARNPASVRKAALESLEGNPNKDRIMYINDNIFDILGKLEKVEGFVIKC